MTSRECLTNDIISSMLVIWTDKGEFRHRPFRTKINELLGRSNRMTEDELIENGMSVLSLGYQSYHDRYIDQVDKLLRKYTTCKDYIGMTKGIRLDENEHAEGRVPDADNMSHALSHNAMVREGYFECDGRLISEWAWIAFSDAIVTVGDMALFTVQMKAYLKSKNRDTQNTRKTHDIG